MEVTRFGEKVKHQRERLLLTQEQLGDLIGTTRRTIVSYETGGKLPRKKMLRQLAGALGVTERYLMEDVSINPSDGIDEEPYIQAAMDSYGKKGATEMAALLRQNEILFAGGTLSEEQKDMFFEAIARAYYLNKEKAKEKFGRKNCVCM